MTQQDQTVGVDDFFDNAFPPCRSRVPACVKATLTCGWFVCRTVAPVTASWYVAHAIAMSRPSEAASVTSMLVPLR